MTGVAWLVISFIILRFSTASVATIGILLGIVFLGAAASEMVIAATRAS